MSAMGGSNVPTLSSQKAICENMTLGAYEETDAYRFVQRFLSKRRKRVGSRLICLSLIWGIQVCGSWEF